VRQLLLHAHNISFARADNQVWHLVTYCSTLRCTIGVPRLTQRSVSDFPLEKTPDFGNLVELRCIFYIHQRPHYANLADCARYWVCTVTTNTGVTI